MSEFFIATKKLKKKRNKGSVAIVVSGFGLVDLSKYT